LANVDALGRRKPISIQTPHTARCPEKLLEFSKVLRPLCAALSKSLKLVWVMPRDVL